MSSTLYRNGVVHSPADPFAEALLVADGTVVWIGAEDTAAGLAANADTVVDLDGALVAPAFVDAHVHVLETAIALEGVDLTPAGGVRSLADALAAVRRAADAAPAGSTDRPLVGHGWDETGWPEGRPPTRAELDDAARGRPVYVSRVDVHSAVVSTSFATSAGVVGLPGWTEDGRVERDAHHAARTTARRVDPGHRDALLRRALAAAAAAGIASLHEHSAPGIDTREGLTRLLELTADAAEGLPHVVGYRGELCADPDDARALLAAIPGLTGIGGDLNVDGSIGSRTAALRAPYADARRHVGHRTEHGSGHGADGGAGPLYLTAEQVSAHLRAVAAAGVHAGFHVIGDRAMDEMLAGLRHAAELDGAGALRVAGHRIEHAEMVDAPTIAALALLGVRLSMQPAFEAAWGGAHGHVRRAPRRRPGRDPRPVRRPRGRGPAARVRLRLAGHAVRPVGRRARRDAPPRARAAHLRPGRVPRPHPGRLARRRPGRHRRRGAPHRRSGAPGPVAGRAPRGPGGRRPGLGVEHRRPGRHPAAARPRPGRARAGVRADGPGGRRPARRARLSPARREQGEASARRRVTPGAPGRWGGSRRRCDADNRRPGRRADAPVATRGTRRATRRRPADGPRRTCAR